MADGYTVLARRYRSQNFGELIGQEAIAQTLRNAVTTGRVAHAFMFTGTRGVGKTSAARILAKAINCPQVKQGQPCGVCPACLAIGRGDDIDVIEIDGASNNGVDQIRDLRQSAGIAPSRSPYKIYIIDEVHMLSMAAFNALLKTLEEPPPHVKFIFATTDVHRVPPTILSRCQRYDFKNIPVGRITEHLKNICQQEKATADEAALHRIAILAAGSMRDALSLLDRVLSLGAGRITEALLESLLGSPPVAALAALAGAMADGQAAAVLSQAQQLLADGMAPEWLLTELADFFRNLMILVVCGEDTPLLDVPGEWRHTLAALARRFDAPTLSHHIALCDQTQRSLRGSTMQRPLLDALLVRLALAPCFSALGEWLEKLPDFEPGAPGPAVPPKGWSAISTAPVAAAPGSAAPATRGLRERSAADGDGSRPAGLAPELAAPPPDPPPPVRPATPSSWRPQPGENKAPVHAGSAVAGGPRLTPELTRRAQELPVVRQLAEKLSAQVVAVEILEEPAPRE